MKRRVSTFKLLFFLGSFCLTMWQLPNIIGAVEGAKSGDMSQLLKLVGGAGPNTAAAADQDPERLNELLGELGMPSVEAQHGEESAESSGPPILITPDDSMTPEEARALVDQQRREALERSSKRKPS